MDKNISDEYKSRKIENRYVTYGGKYYSEQRSLHNDKNPSPETYNSPKLVCI